MEEPLPAGGSCLLGSLNLSEFVTNKKFNETEFCQAVKIAVRGLNQVLDEGLSKHPLKEQQDSVKNWRQIGLGIFGLADALIKMEIKYGSSKAVDFIHYMGSRLINSALEESAILAKEFGTYPKYDSRILESEFFKKNACSEAIKLVKSYGLRNSQLLTCAPTGSLASLFNTSGSAEAIFATSYNRKTISLNNKETIYKVYPKIIQDFINSGYAENNLPEYVVTAHQVPYKNRLDMQAALNIYIDASISSTCNVPESISVEEIADLYMYAWESGCKGVTLWRDNCSREAILTTSNSKPIETPYENDTFIKKVSDDCIGKKRNLMTGCGSLHFTAFFDKSSGRLLETYCSKGSQGGCALFMNGLSRMMSLAARGNISVENIVDQLKSAGTCPSYAVRRATKKDTSQGSSCPVAIGYALMDMYNEMQNETKERIASVKTKKKDEFYYSDKNLCPECGAELIMTEGCMSCRSCGYSKC